MIKEMSERIEKLTREMHGKVIRDDVSLTGNTHV